MKPIHIANSPLTNTIFAGHVLKGNRWAAGKQDVTAEALRAEIMDIWADRERNPSAIVMVSHSIREALLMADRVAVLSGSPGTLRTILDVTLPRPRDSRSPEFMKLVDHLHDIITSAELPDVLVTAPVLSASEEEDRKSTRLNSSH